MADDADNDRNQKTNTGTVGRQPTRPVRPAIGRQPPRWHFSYYVPDHSLGSPFFAAAEGHPASRRTRVELAQSFHGT